MASKSGKVGFKFSEPCPDCLRLRALLGEARKILRQASLIVSAMNGSEKWEARCDDLASRIAKELEETK